MSGGHDVEREPHRHEHDRTMLDYDFMRTAFAAAGIVAVVAGLVGYFLVLRGQTFAGHALAHVGFTGATGAVLIGVSPLAGLVAADRRRRHRHGAARRAAGAARRRDRHRAGAVARSRPAVPALLHRLSPPRRPRCCSATCWRSTPRRCGCCWCSASISLGTLAVISRPLLFASLQPELAEAKGVSLRLYSIAVPGDRRARDRRVRPDRRRAAGLRADGRTGGGGAAPHHRSRERAAALGRPRARRGLARADARLLHRLADAASGSRRSARSSICSRPCRGAAGWGAAPPGAGRFPAPPTFGSSRVKISPRSRGSWRRRRSSRWPSACGRPRRAEVGLVGGDDDGLAALGWTARMAMRRSGDASGRASVTRAAGAPPGEETGCRGCRCGPRRWWRAGPRAGA